MLLSLLHSSNLGGTLSARFFGVQKDEHLPITKQCHFELDNMHNISHCIKKKKASALFYSLLPFGITLW